MSEENKDYRTGYNDGAYDKKEDIFRLVKRELASLDGDFHDELSLKGFINHLLSKIEPDPFRRKMLDEQTPVSHAEYVMALEAQVKG